MSEPNVIKRGKQGFTNLPASNFRHVGVPPECRHVLMRDDDVPPHCRSGTDLVLVEGLTVTSH